MTEEIYGQIRSWRAGLLGKVADILSAGGMADIQKDVGVWNNGGDIPYPPRAGIRVVNDECLNFKESAGGADIMFSIWVMTGEVRIGVKVPAKLAMTEAARAKLSCAYDGKPAHRTHQDGADFMFDWIWQDREFASFDFMATAMFSEKHTAMIADRIGQIIVHLYLSIMTIIIDTNNLAASHGAVVRGKRDLYMVSLTGDAEAFKWRLARMGGVVKSVDQAGSAPAIYHVLIPQNAPVNSLAPGNEIQDQDGGRCRINSFKKVE